MSKIFPDYSESQDFSPMVEGEYTCEIISCEPKLSKQNNRYLNWKLQTIPDRRTFYYTTVIEGKGAGMLKHFLKCILGDYDGGEFDTDQVMNKLVKMYLKIKEVETPNGKQKYFEVKEVMPNSDGDAF